MSACGDAVAALLLQMELMELQFDRQLNQFEEKMEEMQKEQDERFIQWSHMIEVVTLERGLRR